jgi:hypothetical protein
LQDGRIAEWQDGRMAGFEVLPSILQLILQFCHPAILQFWIAIME